MYNFVRILAACGVALILAIGASACGGASEEVVARVGKSAITKAALAHWLSIQASTNGPTTSDPSGMQPLALDPPPFAACSARRVVPASPSGESVSASIKPPASCHEGRSALKRRALEFLISSTSTLGQAAELGVKVADRQVEREYRRFKYNEIYGASLPSPKEAELRTLLSGKGETYADKLWIMRVHLLAEKVEQARTMDALGKIGRAQVVAYYKKNRQRFVLPERRDIVAIMTYGEAGVRRAKQEIKAGKSFVSVANRRNEQPSEGGVKLGLTRGKGKKRYERDFFAAPAHVLVGPLKELLYYIFEVRKIVPAKQQTLAQVEGPVRRQLIAGQERRLLIDTIDEFERKWQAKTSCQLGYVARQCGHYLRG